MSVLTRLPLLRPALVLALAGAAMAATPAEAQFFFDYYAGPIRPAPPPFPGPYPAPPRGDIRLSPREIVQAVRDQGYRATSRPMLNRNVYALDAADRAGRPVRLIVEAWDGEILQAIPMAAPPPGLQPEGRFVDPGEPRVIPAPVPPRQPQKPRAQRPPPPKALQAEPAPLPAAPAPELGAAPPASGPVPVAPLDAPPAAAPAPDVPVTPLD